VSSEQGHIALFDGTERYSRPNDESVANGFVRSGRRLPTVAQSLCASYPRGYTMHVYREGSQRKVALTRPRCKVWAIDRVHVTVHVDSVPKGTRVVYIIRQGQTKSRTKATFPSHSYNNALSCPQRMATNAKRSSSRTLRSRSKSVCAGRVTQNWVLRATVARKSVVPDRDLIAGGVSFFHCRNKWTQKQAQPIKDRKDGVARRPVSRYELQRQSKSLGSTRVRKSIVGSGESD
jgi:hypothetical protein